jgi:recombination DNA repair RAD52 pathway protein
MRTHDDVVKDLDSDIPRKAIATREGGGRSKLSYLEGWYVIDRLNKVVGQGNWSYDSTVTLLHTGTNKNSRGEDVHSVHYSCRTLLVVRFPNGEQGQYVDYGYGDGSDKQNIGKAHELAIKESVTDALKRCAKNLGMSMGLALYDKTQENVEDESPKAVAQAPKPTPPTTIAPPATGRDTLNKKITAISRVVIVKRLKTLDELKADMKTKYGADSAAALTDAQATELNSALEKLAGA